MKGKVYALKGSIAFASIDERDEVCCFDLIVESGVQVSDVVAGNLESSGAVDLFNETRGFWMSVFMLDRA